MRSLESLKLLTITVGHMRTSLLKHHFSQCKISMLRRQSSYKPNTGSALVAISEKVATSRTLSKHSNTNTSLISGVSPLSNTASFGVAKDRSPVKQMKKHKAYRDEPTIRYDKLYLKKPEESGQPDLSRNYSQTWTEFPQGRVRPVTEWGNSHPRKRN